MKRLLFLLLLILSLTFVAPTNAFIINGHDLVKLIRESEQQTISDLKSGFLSGYIVGVASTSVGMFRCPTVEKMTPRQMRAIVSLYVKRHPEKWGERAQELIILALNEKFPCQE